MLVPKSTNPNLLGTSIPVTPVDDGHIVLFGEGGRNRAEENRSEIGTRGRAIRILLVEGWTGDYQLIIENFRHLDIPVDVTWANRGEKALAYLGDPDRRFDMVLIDPILPGIDGWEVMDELQNRGYGKDLVVVVQAATRSEFLLQRCCELGVEAAIEKPVTADGFRILLDALGFGSDALSAIVPSAEGSLVPA